MKRTDVLSFASSLSGETGHCEVLNIYNSQKSLPRNYAVRLNDPWCATFVSACFLKYGYDAISECSCNEMIKKAQKAGIWVEDDSYKPSLGDILMYDWQDNGKGDNQGTPDHVGIVIGISDTTITVREGNKSSSIGNRSVPINGKYIRGYITPPYEAASHLDLIIERIAGVDIDTLYKKSGASGVTNEMIRIVKEGY